MANAYDPYREALVVEQRTIWPEEFDAWEPAAKREVEARLQSEPQACAELDYTRLHTGFCRDITVTQADLNRLGVVQS